MKPVGKPDAGNPHVRFDERGGETGRVSDTAPLLDSTTFRDRVVRLWLRPLRRRGQHDKTAWERMKRLADDFLPKPRILHPWPEQRFAVKHPRWEPYAGMPHVRFCTGGAQ